MKDDWTNKIAKVKPEWLNPYEDPDTLYFVIEDREDRVLVGLLEPTTQLIFGTWCWSKEWCYLV
jgi:hypothetical protein